MRLKLFEESCMSKVYISDTVFYNKASSCLLGWDPTWFNLPVSQFGPKLLSAVKKFQKEHNITVDGLVGSGTFGRLETQREALTDPCKFINVGLKEIKVTFPRINVSKYYGTLPPKNYKKQPLQNARKVNKLVIHWDAALSAASCYKVLHKRGYSTHFCLDNDGTIFQFLNTNHKAYHVRESNGDSIGIDISNAFYLKYNETYERRGFGKRPVITSKVNGHKVGPHLGYYPEQIKAAKALIKALCKEYDIPLEMPTEFVDDPKNTPGVMFHYHLNDNKIDTAGFPLEQILSELKEEQ